MSDVKGWSPEYQSILETFDMINNKYENPDVSKDLNITYVNAWTNTTKSLNTYGPLNWNSSLNKNLVYPFDSLPLTYSGLKVVGSQQYLNLNSVLQDVYRTVVYKCKPCMTESSSSSESSSESSSSSSIYHGGEGSGGSSSSSNTPTGTAAFQNAMKNLKSFTVPNGGFIRGT